MTNYINFCIGYSKKYLKYHSFLVDFLLYNLPLDIVHIILSYSDTVKLRNGKYMNQIQQKDPRYYLLQTIPKSIIYNLIDEVHFSNGDFLLKNLFHTWYIKKMP
jgi:hypothetical protein